MILIFTKIRGTEVHKDERKSATMTEALWPWVLFTGFIFGMLALDLGVFYRDAYIVA